MLGLSTGQVDLVVVTTAFKLLLYPAYRSTDFEVHRNWLAITHSLPLSRWYYEATSQWTLDYPPFFAFFSYILGLPARYLLPRAISDDILRISASPIETWPTVAYMRTTVLVSELCLLWAVLRVSAGKQATAAGSSALRAAALAIFLHPGFIILDSIHFQYNGFLFGIMLISLAAAKEGRPLLCAGAFAALLNFKHIYVYLAPAWFIYLFRAYCFPPSLSSIAPALNIGRLSQIGSVTLGVFALSIGPFLAHGMDQGKQLLSRLFPFTRGLMHAYWAPNVWALAAIADRVLLKASSRLPFLHASAAGIASTSRGLVGDTHFAILPNIQPSHCFAITALAQVVLLIPLWRRPTYPTFLAAITHCAFSSFMFGWHVHEKAVMLVLVPLTLLVTTSRAHYRIFLVASVSGIYSLFPLLFQAMEHPIKVIYSSLWLFLVHRSLAPAGPSTSKSSPLAERVENAYLLGFIPLHILVTSLPFLSRTTAAAAPRWEFLPLMITSVYCAMGLVWAWARLMAITHLGDQVDAMRACAETRAPQHDGRTTSRMEGSNPMITTTTSE